LTIRHANSRKATQGRKINVSTDGSKNGSGGHPEAPGYAVMPQVEMGQGVNTWIALILPGGDSSASALRWLGRFGNAASDLNEGSIARLRGQIAQ
jgi:hypothetical protein